MGVLNIQPQFIGCHGMFPASVKDNWLQCKRLAKISWLRFLQCVCSDAVVQNRHLPLRPVGNRPSGAVDSVVCKRGLQVPIALRSMKWCQLCQLHMRALNLVQGMGSKPCGSIPAGGCSWLTCRWERIVHAIASGVSRWPCASSTCTSG